MAGLARTADQDRQVIGKLVDDLLAGSKKLLLLPFATLAAPFPKLVRDLCHDQGKKACEELKEKLTKLYSDIEKGFIRAEVVRWNDLLAAGSVAAAREKAQVRLEGREYVVQEGDVILFRHSG